MEMTLEELVTEIHNFLTDDFLDELEQDYVQTPTTIHPFRVNMGPKQISKLLSRCYYKVVRDSGHKVIFTESLKKVFAHISLFLAKKDTPKKGFICCGNVGTGKSSLMKAFQQLVNELRRRGALSDPGNGREWGMEIIAANTYTTQKAGDPKTEQKFFEAKMLGIDDLGCENVDVVSYGNRTQPIVTLLERRYDRRFDNFTFITTNIPPKEFKNRFDERIIDRFREQYEVIVFTGTSFRRVSL